VNYAGEGVDRAHPLAQSSAHRHLTLKLERWNADRQSLQANFRQGSAATRPKSVAPGGPRLRSPADPLDPSACHARPNQRQNQPSTATGGSMRMSSNARLCERHRIRGRLKSRSRGLDREPANRERAAAGKPPIHVLLIEPASSFVQGSGQGAGSRRAVCRSIGARTLVEPGQDLVRHRPSRETLHMTPTVVVVVELDQRVHEKHRVITQHLELSASAAPDQSHEHGSG